MTPSKTNQIDIGGDYDCGDEPEEEESQRDSLDEGSESEAEDMD